MNRRGPKSSLSMYKLRRWEAEWNFFFDGLRNGFPPQSCCEWHIPGPPGTNAHPLLQEERQKFAMVIRREQRSIPGFLPEKKTWKKLLAATTEPALQKACKESRYWPKKSSNLEFTQVGYLLSLIWKLAPIFLAAKLEKRYPAGDRPTSEDKKARFLAQAMAGACNGIAPRYAVDKLTNK